MWVDGESEEAIASKLGLEVSYLRYLRDEQGWDEIRALKVAAKMTECEDADERAIIIANAIDS